MTISDAFVVESGGGMPHGSPSDALEEARLGSGPRARIAVTDGDGKIRAAVKSWGATVASDIREAWWTPASLPTVQRAWADRMPDRDRVPFDNTFGSVLYGGWVAYNHTLGLAVPAVGLALIGLISMFVWAAQHPARFALTVVIVTATIALIFG